MKPLARIRFMSNDPEIEARIAPKVEATVALLADAVREHGRVLYSSSLGAESIVLTDLIWTHAPSIEIFTLDTGRLHGDTLRLIDAIGERYGRAIEIYRPEPAAVREYVDLFGRDAFYRSTNLRKRCCEIRKVEPLRRALAGKRAWLTGLRREQSEGRAGLPARAFDPVHGIEKFNPLADWGEDEVWHYLLAFGVPYNPLYDQGYRSIGCAPCTRPVTPDEDVRAGRWWWEAPESKECGLHLGPDGRLARVTEHAV
jgi:phosphoadenosine phosphosulfate reductase